MWCAMSEAVKPKGSSGLPDFLEVSILKGVIDERTARRVELFRRSRGLGPYESQSAFLNDPPDPGLTFDNLVVCKGNSFAVELAKTVSYKSPSRLPYNPLYFYADIGLGKTHLLSAIANAAVERRVLLLNVADLELEVERAIRLHKRAELREWLLTAEILLLDDIQLCEGREDVQRDLFAVLNHMLRAHRWVVITSDVPPTRLAGVESRLLSRLGAGVIVSLHMGDRNECRDLIKSFVQDRPMPEEIIDYLAENVTENVRGLKAAVAQLLTLSAGTDAPLTLDMARTVVPAHEAHGPLPAQEDSVPTGSQLPQAERGSRAQAPVNRIREMLAGAEYVIRHFLQFQPYEVDRFKEMLATAESKEEQALALQIALGTRIRQLRGEGGDPDTLNRLEQALDLLREGKMEQAVEWIST